MKPQKVENIVLTFYYEDGSKGVLTTDRAILQKTEYGLETTFDGEYKVQYIEQEELPTHAFQLTPDHEGLYISMRDYDELIEGILEDVLPVTEYDHNKVPHVVYVFISVNGKQRAIMRNYTIRVSREAPLDYDGGVI